jgi:hypothetical protein
MGRRSTRTGHSARRVRDREPAQGRSVMNEPRHRLTSWGDFVEPFERKYGIRSPESTSHHEAHSHPQARSRARDSLARPSDAVVDLDVPRPDAVPARDRRVSAVRARGQHHGAPRTERHRDGRASRGDQLHGVPRAVDHPLPGNTERIVVMRSIIWTVWTVQPQSGEVCRMVGCYRNRGQAMARLRGLRSSAWRASSETQYTLRAR